MNCEFDLKMEGRRRRFNDGAKCRVCGDKSIGLNFGVHTCSPCKAFFRRNAVKLDVGHLISSSKASDLFRHMNFDVEMMEIVQ